MEEALVAEKHEHHTADSPVEIRLSAKEAQICGFPTTGGNRILHTRLVGRESYELEAALHLIIRNRGVACDRMRSNEHLRPMRCPECGTKIGVHHP